MKKFNRIIALLCLSCTLTCMGQQQYDRDYRNELNLLGGFPVFTLAPDGTCWLTSGSGHVYYTENIQSDWHCAAPFFHTDNHRDSLPAWIDINQLSFLDSTTAIAIAYDHWGKQSYCYHSENRGKSWSQHPIGERLTLEQICMDAQGHTWLAGSGYNHILFYSDDKGKTFFPLQLPVASPDWAKLTALDMRDGQYGLAGLDIKLDTFHLLLTEDNWRTSKQISTPLGNGKEIDKVLLWKDLWVIRQGNEVFYTSSQNLQWQHFPIKVMDFYPDRENGSLIAITDNNEVMVFTSPTNYRSFTPEPLPAKPATAIMYHGTLYAWAVGQILCKADERGMISASHFYTTEEQIKTPYLVREGEQQLWGIDFRNVLYLADKSDGRWYRCQQMPLDVKTFKLLNDSTALFWDGQQHYKYSLADKQLRDYVLTSPLQDFLTAPVTEVVLCGGHTDFREDTIRYLINSDEELHTSFATLTHIKKDHYCRECPVEITRKNVKFRHEASRQELDSILSDINRNYSKIPTIPELQITEKDVQNYYKLLEKTNFMNLGIKMNPRSRFYDFDYMEDFYRTVPNRTDTLIANTLRKILYKHENWHCSGGAHWFTIQVMNSNSDTLLFSHYNIDHEYAWYLPWLVEYNGMPFRCYSIALSRWVSDCLPGKFYGKECFDNAHFLLQVANYLWLKHSNGNF